MLLTNILSSAILLAKSRETLDETENKTRHQTVKLTGGKDMLIYDSLNYLEETNAELGINPVSYVVLSCAR